MVIRYRVSWVYFLGLEALCQTYCGLQKPRPLRSFRVRGYIGMCTGLDSMRPQLRVVWLHTVASCYRCPARHGPPKSFEFYNFLGHVLYFTRARTSFFWVLSPNRILSYSDIALRLRFLSALFWHLIFVIYDCVSWRHSSSGPLP